MAMGGLTDFAWLNQFRRLRVRYQPVQQREVVTNWRRELVTSVLRPPGRKENLQWVMENLLCFAYLLTLILEQHHVTGLTPAGQGRALAVRGPRKSKDLARLEICQLPRRTATHGLAPQV